MKTVEQEGIYRVTVHSIDEAMWNLGIRLTNSEWMALIEILDVLLSLEV